jgi:hypothetical protein
MRLQSRMYGSSGPRRGHCDTGITPAGAFNRFLAMATSTYIDTAIQIWVFTAFSLVP